MSINGRPVQFRRQRQVEVITALVVTQIQRLLMLATGGCPEAAAA